jgi:hypothetical protein
MFNLDEDPENADWLKTLPQGFVEIFGSGAVSVEDVRKKFPDLAGLVTLPVFKSFPADLAEKVRAAL